MGIFSQVMPFPGQEGMITWSDSGEGETLNLGAWDFSLRQ